MPGAGRSSPTLARSPCASFTLPAIEGLAARWGRSVLHCPYCHGYELDRGAIGVIATGPRSLHQAQLVAGWGPVTLLAKHGPEPRCRGGGRPCPARHRCDQGEAVIRLPDRRLLRFAGIFTASRNHPATPIAAGPSCAVEETPFDTQIRSDATREIRVPGAFASGDAAREPHAVSLAVADGAWARKCTGRWCSDPQRRMIRSDRRPCLRPRLCPRPRSRLPGDSDGPASDFGTV